MKEIDFEKGKAEIGGAFDLEEKRKEKREILEINRGCLVSITAKIDELEKLVLDRKFKSLRHNEYFYPLKDWPVILQKFKDLEAALYEIVENPEIRFVPENNVEHLVGNGIQMYSRLVDMYLRSAGLVQGVEKVTQRDLGQKELGYLAKNKRTWDLTLYYIDQIEQVENRNLLIEEMTKEDGFLTDEEAREFLLNKKAADHFTELELFNFLSRIEGRESKIKELRGMGKISGSVTEENFEEEFEKMEGKDKFNKEKLFEFLKSKRKAA